MADILMCHCGTLKAEAELHAGGSMAIKGSRNCKINLHSVPSII